MHNTKKELAIITIAIIAIIFSVGELFSIDGGGGGGCGANCIGDGKAVSSLSCTYNETSGKAISFSCSTDWHAINNTHTCCCCDNTSALLF